MPTEKVTWNQFLDQIIQSPSQHHLWLRSLSYLEYIGYRKMVKAVPYTKISTGVYHHLSDEIQHSFMLREIADKQFGLSLPIEQVTSLVGIAENYFQGLDSQVDDWIKTNLGKEDAYASYVWVSYTIEKRAMKVYPQYLAKLNNPALKLVVQKIIKDEADHLSYLGEVIEQFPEEIGLKNTPVLDIEERCFDGFLEKMDHYFKHAKLEHSC